MGAWWKNCPASIFVSFMWCKLLLYQFPDKERGMRRQVPNLGYAEPRDGFKNSNELLYIKALKISTLYKNCFFKCMSKIFSVEFQRYPLKFPTKYLTHTLNFFYFIRRWKELLKLRARKRFWKAPPPKFVMNWTSTRHHALSVETKLVETKTILVSALKYLLNFCSLIYHITSFTKNM